MTLHQLHFSGWPSEFSFFRLLLLLLLLPCVLHFIFIEQDRPRPAPSTRPHVLSSVRNDDILPTYGQIKNTCAQWNWPSFFSPRSHTELSKIRFPRNICPRGLVGGVFLAASSDASLCLTEVASGMMTASSGRV